MLIRIGFDIAIACAQPTPVVLKVLVEPDRCRDLRSNDLVATAPFVSLTTDVDVYGNRELRGVAPAGDTEFSMSAIVYTDGRPDPVNLHARQTTPAELPADVLRFLQPSRYCESDLLSAFAWSKFGSVPEGWQRVQAIADHVNSWLTFGYENADMFRTAVGAHAQRRGVCRDFVHLAIALCRAMNIPARYCNGYLGDIGVPANPSPMDFNAWFETFIGDQWYTFDARHNQRRVGRIVISRGLDAADCAILHTFGQHVLKRFTVETLEIMQPNIVAA